MLRLAEARRQGQVARSADLTGAAVILAGVVTLWLGGGVLLTKVTEMFGAMLSFAPVTPDVGVATGGAVWSAVGPVVWITLCFCGVVVLGAVVAGVAQVGFHVSEDVITPKLDRISPSQGLGRLFSSRGLVRATLAVTKIASVAFVAWITIGALLPQIASDSAAGVEIQWSSAWTMLGLMAWRIVLVLAVLGGVDWLWQWRRHRNDLMMTRREVLEDLRKSEGDPLMRSRQRKNRQTQTGDEA
jgi:flagellar biosynthetic protein FlhB